MILHFGFERLGLTHNDECNDSLVDKSTDLPVQDIARLHYQEAKDQSSEEEPKLVPNDTLSIWRSCISLLRIYFKESESFVECTIGFSKLLFV